MARDKKKEAQQIREIMLERKRKMETDPEYRKRVEESEAAFEEAFHLKQYTRQED